MTLLAGSFADHAGPINTKGHKVDQIVEIFGNINKRYKDMGDGTHAEVMFAGDPATSGSASIISQVEMYEAIADSTDVTAGNIIRRLELINSVAGTSISVTWTNVSTNQVLASPPPPATLALTGSTGLTDAELRASPVPVADAQALAKLEELRVQLVGLLGNTDQIEAMQESAIALLTLTNQYVDGLEALVTTLTQNTDTLEPLISVMSGYVDAVEPLLIDIKALATTDATTQANIVARLEAVRDRLPATIGPKAAAESMSVTLATDEALPLPTGAATAADQVLQTTQLEIVAAKATSIDTKTPALGQALKAASVPVTLASDQPAIPTTIVGEPRTPSMTLETIAGTVATGALSVSFANIGTTSATVAGGTLPAGYSVTFDAPKGDTLAAISYTASVTAGLLISKIV